MTDYKKQQQDNQKKFDAQKQQQKTGQHTAPMSTPTTGKPGQTQQGGHTDKNKTKPTGGKY